MIDLSGKRTNAMGKLCNRMLIALFAATAFVSCSPQYETKAAPAVTFMTIKGEKIAINDLRGKVVLVNFWATDCPICLKELPQLIA
ncbi:MAG TPA: TlpA disulfide reductase family protein, partial [Burkholderiales bacterium]|nr:TlpA disulfide reductase family protein [Burkholderiales bacterium]